jgi:antitoxin YefM
VIISASKAREKLFPLIEQVNQDQMSVTITSNNGNAVLVSESEWESILETAFLLRASSNRKALEASLAQADANQGKKVKYTKGQVLNQLIEASSKKGSQGKKSTVKGRKTKAKVK